jgi:hypothetical protein
VADGPLTGLAKGCLSLPLVSTQALNFYTKALISERTLSFLNYRALVCALISSALQTLFKSPEKSLPETKSVKAS